MIRQIRHFLYISYRLLLELAVIMLIYGVALLITSVSYIALPGSIVGMLLLLILLHLKWVKVDQIRYISTFLLSNMSLFFIPAGVSVMASYHYIENNYLVVVAVILLSTLLVMSFTAVVVEKIVRHSKHE